MATSSSKPTISAQTGSLIEDTNSSTASIQLGASSGSLGFDDVALMAGGWLRVGTSTSYTHVGLYGLATLDTLTGKITYALDNSLLATNKLAGGAAAKDTFTVPDTIAGVKFSTAVTFNIKGTNDAAVIEGNNTATITETNAIQSASGTLSVSDVDSAEKFVAQSNVNGSAGFGKFTINTAGVWTYTMNTAHDEFKAGTIYKDSVTVKAADGTSQVITVNIVGTDDALVFGGVTTASLTETNAVLKASGTMTAVDADAPVSILAQTNVAGDHGYGVFSIATNGKWTYTANTAHNEFQAGTNYTDSFTVTTSDGSSKVVTVNIAGTNDAAVITGTTTGTVNEAGGINNAIVGSPFATGALTDTDVDGTNNKFIEVASAKASLYGSFTMTSAGVWNYTLDNNNATVQALAVGKTLSDTFTVNAEDGTAKSITVTIKGADDAAVITGTNTAALTETNLAQTTTGQLKSTDVDSATASAFVAQNNVAGDHGYGKFTVDTTGKWTYAMNTAHDEFQGGQSYSDSFTVKTADGASKLVTVTMLGTNDAAIITGTSELNLTETNQALTTTGMLTSTDVDGTANRFMPETVIGNYGTLTVLENGAWSYTTDSAHDEFIEGQVYKDILKIHSADGTEKLITVNITGTNDAAIIIGPKEIHLTETDDILSTSGQLIAIDPDGPEHPFISQTIQGDFGSFTINADGQWVYKTNSAHNEFAVGSVYTDPFVVRTVDGVTEHIVINIDGTNDAPIIRLEGGDNFYFDDHTVSTFDLRQMDRLSITDPEGDALTYSFAGQPAPGFTLNPDGTGTVDTRTYNYLAEGEVLNIPAALIARDVHGAEASQGVNAVIIGTNDVATITTSRALHASDITDPLHQFYNATNGHIYEINTTPLSWNDAMHAADAKTIAGVHGYLATITSQSEQNFVWSSFNSVLYKKADAWLGGSDAVIEGDWRWATGPEVGTQFWQGGNYGSGHPVDGNYVNWYYYEPDNWSGFQNWGIADEAVLNSEGYWGDAEGFHTINSIVEYSAPVTGGGTTFELIETDSAASLSTSGKFYVSDADHDQAHTIAKTVGGTYGTFTIDSDGSWTYTASSAHNELSVGQRVNDTFDVSSVDGTATAQVVINITGTNDAPIIRLEGGDNFYFDDHTVSIFDVRQMDRLSITDPEGDALTYSFAGQPAPGFTLNPDGTGTIDTRAYNYLAEGEVLNIPAALIVRDVHGAEASQGVNAVIVGTNDAAIITGTSSGNVNEDSSTVASGTLSIVDTDTGESVFASPTTVGLTGTYGAFTFNATSGAWTYAVDNSKTAVQALASGSTVTDTLTVYSYDGTTSKAINATVTGVNDAAVITNHLTNFTNLTEIKANTFTIGDQTNPDLTALSDGGWVMTWESIGIDASDSGVYQQRFTSLGEPIGDQIKVNTYTMSSSIAFRPEVTGLSDGGWVVTWQSKGQDGSGYGVYQQRFTSDGVAYGNELQVNSYTSGDQYGPSITGLSDGGWVITWHSDVQDGSGYGVFQQRFTSSGTASGNEVQVNTHTPAPQGSSAVTALSDGGWVVTWESEYQDGSSFGIYQQKYSITGLTDGAESRVNTTTLGCQATPSVTALSDGGWVVTWRSEGQDGSGWGVYQQRYSNAGVSIGEELKVNTFLINDQLYPSVSSLSDGGWVVTWQSNGQDGSASGIYQKRYTSTGETNGAELKVNTYTSDEQINPSLTGLSDGGWVVTWQSNGQDGSGFGIYQQRFNSDGFAIEYDTSTSSNVMLFETNYVLTASGMLTSTDVDGIANAFKAEKVVGTYGSLAMDASGAWTYTASSAQNQLSAGATATDTFTIHAADSTASSITVVITGMNDLATVSSATTAVSEGNTAAELNASGKLTISDADEGQAVVVAKDFAGTYGTFHVAEDGSWTYKGNGPHDELTDGQSVSDSIVVTSNDGTGNGVITVNIIGTSDFISYNSNTIAIEDQLPISQNINLNNPYPGYFYKSIDLITDAGWKSYGGISMAGGISGIPSWIYKSMGFTGYYSSAGQYGSALLDVVTGEVTYRFNNNIESSNALSEGELVKDVFYLPTHAGITNVLSFYIIGSNDAAVISGTSTFNLTETNEVLATSGTLTSTDVDGIANSFKAETVVGTYGSLAMDAHGAWTYTTSSSHDEFVKDQVYTDVVTVHAADGTEKVIAINITGTDDLTLIGEPSVFNLIEDSGSPGFYNNWDIGQPGANDTSQNDAIMLINHSGFTPGLWHDTADWIGPTRMWGSIVEYVGNFSSNDISDPTYQFLNLQNGNIYEYLDSPLAWDSALERAGSRTINGVHGGLVTITSAEEQSFVLSHNPYPQINGYWLGATDKQTEGVWRWVSGLEAGHIFYSSIDPQGNSYQSINLTASGTISIIDVDSAARFNTTVLPALGNLGVLTLTAEGSYTYSVANSAVSYLGAGETKLEVFTVSTLDGTEKVITFNITGTDDLTLINGTNGADTLSGGFGDDVIYGLAGNDTIDGSAGDDVIYGLGGDDRIDAGAGNNSVSGGDGNDYITANQGSNLVIGGAGNDYLAVVSSTGKESLFGGFGDDSLFAVGKLVIEDGGEGNDNLEAQGKILLQEGEFSVINGSADLSGGGGDDGLYVTSYSQSTLSGGDGNDILQARKNQASDPSCTTSMVGGSGDDNLATWDINNATLEGDDGNDYLYAQSFDLGTTANLSGGAGYDNLKIFGYSNVSLDGGDENDSLLAQGITSPSFAIIGGSKSIANLNGGAGNDNLEVAYYSSAKVDGGDGNDNLNVYGTRSSYLIGGSGDDNLRDVTDLWTTWYTDGALSIGRSATLDGGTGNDKLNFESWQNSFASSSISAKLLGGDGDDSLSAIDNQAGITHEYGTRNTGIAHALLDGGAGDDLLLAGGVIDLTMTGGTGADVFVLTTQQFLTELEGAKSFFISQTLGGEIVDAHATVITDFEVGAGHDLLDVSELLRNASTGFDGSNPFSNGYLTLEQSGTDTLLKFDADGLGADKSAVAIAVLKNVTATDLVADNFNPNFTLPLNDYYPTH